MMNIIGGIYKGRRIYMPKGIEIRPTSNKVREALFNILGNRVLDAAVLDLFAGTGSLGLEALSRGTNSAVFVDKDFRCINTIKRNLEMLGITSNAEVMQLDALQGIKKFSGKSKFDLIFLDPPYFKDWVKKVLINLVQYDILTKFSVVVCEHHKKEAVPEDMVLLMRFRQSLYGDTALSFYRIKP